MTKEVTVKEAGYAYVFLSHENPTFVEVYFDDVVMTHTPSNVIQYNEYYPFGLQTANSWTRENTTGNNYLYNAANELNQTSGWYEMFYRGYDPATGRMLQVDPYASSFSSFTPYNYAVNNPIGFNDPSGGVVMQSPDINPDPDEQLAWLRRNAIYESGGYGGGGGGGTRMTFDFSNMGSYNPGGDQSTPTGTTTINIGNTTITVNWDEVGDEIVHIGMDNGSITSVGTNINLDGSYITLASFYYDNNGNPTEVNGVSAFGQVIELQTPDNSGQQTQGGETWYYAYQGPHALAYRPATNTLYEVNHPTVDGEVVDGFWSWLGNGPKSQVYAWDMKSKTASDAFWAFKNRSELMLAPVYVANPSAAVAFFEANVGGEHPYHVLNYNCQNYVLNGFLAGEAQVTFPLLFLGRWSSGQYPSIAGKP